MIFNRCNQDYSLEKILDLFSDYYECDNRGLSINMSQNVD